MHETLELVEGGLALIGIQKADIPTLILVLLAIFGSAVGTAVYRYRVKCEKISCETIVTAADTISSMSERLDKIILNSEKNSDELSDIFREEVKEIQVTLRGMSNEMIRMSYVHLGMAGTYKKRKDIKHED